MTRQSHTLSHHATASCSHSGPHAPGRSCSEAFSLSVMAITRSVFIICNGNKQGAFSLSVMAIDKECFYYLS